MTWYSREVVELTILSSTIVFKDYLEVVELTILSSTIVFKDYLEVVELTILSSTIVFKDYLDSRKWYFMKVCPLLRQQDFL